MFKKILKIKYITFLLLIIFVLIVFIIPIEVPYAVKLPAKILSHKEWYIIKGPDGRLITSLTDNLSGTGAEYTVQLFQRGDNIQFRLDENLKAGQFVQSGDSIGFIYSNEIERQIARIEGELASERAALQLNLTGQKASVIEESRQQLKAAEIQAELQHSILKRQKELFERNLIPREEYEVHLSAAAVFDADVALAKARLQTVLSGEKSEQIQFIQAQIDALDKEKNIYEKRLNQQVIHSPISGQVSRVFASDTLLMINETNSYVMLIPVQLGILQELKPDQKVSFIAPFSDVEIVTAIKSIENRIANLAGKQIVLAVASVNVSTNLLLPGIYVKAEVELGRIPLKDYVLKYLRNTTL